LVDGAYRARAIRAQAIPPSSFAGAPIWARPKKCRRSWFNRQNLAVVNHMLTIPDELGPIALIAGHDAHGHGRKAWGSRAMEHVRIKLVGGTDTQGAGASSAQDALRDAMVAQCLAAAQAGNSDALFDLAMAFSTGSHGLMVDLIEAHKWFNLAAVGGHEDAAHCRADLSEEMTAREIAEAQRRAREWLRAGNARQVA
jgi:hypothetical protein